MATVLITGASRGIGLATARELAARGDRVILASRSESALAKATSSIRKASGIADYLVADLSSIGGAQKLANQVRKRFPSLDTLILNAGASEQRLFSATPPRELKREFEVNYFAPAALLHAFADTAVGRKGGKIVVVGSLTAEIPFPGHANYAASKAAIRQLVRTLRIEWQGRGVHLGIVLPGFTRTAMTQGLQSWLPQASPESVAKAIRHCLDKRVAVVIPGLDNRLAHRLSNLFPGTFDSAVERLATLLVPGYGGLLG